ncbi:MAG: N-acetyltransferase family protein [Vicinamibacterales bacterium]
MTTPAPPSPPGRPAAAVTIRALDGADAEGFRTIRLAALLDTPSAFGASHHEEIGQPLAWFAARLAAPDSVMFGAFVDGALAGIAGVVREPAAKERHRAAIRSMFVAPAYRGRGLAAALLARALEAADAMPGVWQVVLTVTRGNTPAVRLYEAHGFTAYGVLPASLHVDGRYYDDVLMIRVRRDARAPAPGRP